MTYKDLFYFTGHCLALDEHPQFREKIIELFAGAKDSISFLKDGIPVPQEEKDLENFIQLCSDHLIIPPIYLQFKKHDILDYLPEDFIQAFKEIYDLNRERNQQILLQIDDITAILSKENIQPVFLKGTANLLDGIYSDVGERMIGDIDFLVKEEDFLKTAELLEAAGYKKPANNYFDVFRFKHYPVLTKDGEPTYIEIHRLPVDQKYDASLNSELIFSQKKEVPGKPGMYVPSDEHKLIHTFIHSQLADNGHTYMLADFRVLNDLYRLSKRMDVSTLTQQSNYPNEASSWLCIGRRLLDLPDLCPVEIKSAQRYSWKFNWSLNHVKTYQAYLFMKKLFLTIFMRYGKGLVQMLLMFRTYLKCCKMGI